jgi:hypothetical protein
MMSVLLLVVLLALYLGAGGRFVAMGDTELLQLATWYISQTDLREETGRYSDLIDGIVTQANDYPTVGDHSFDFFKPSSGCGTSLNDLLVEVTGSDPQTAKALHIRSVDVSIPSTHTLLVSILFDFSLTVPTFVEAGFGWGPICWGQPICKHGDLLTIADNGDQLDLTFTFNVSSNRKVVVSPRVQLQLSNDPTLSGCSILGSFLDAVLGIRGRMLEKIRGAIAEYASSFTAEVLAESTFCPHPRICVTAWLSDFGFVANDSMRFSVTGTIAVLDNGGSWQTFQDRNADAALLPPRSFSDLIATWREVGVRVDKSVRISSNFWSACMWAGVVTDSLHVHINQTVMDAVVDVDVSISLPLVSLSATDHMNVTMDSGRVSVLCVNQPGQPALLDATVVDFYGTGHLAFAEPSQDSPSGGIYLQLDGLDMRALNASLRAPRVPLPAEVIADVIRNQTAALVPTVNQLLASSPFSLPPMLQTAFSQADFHTHQWPTGYMELTDLCGCDAASSRTWPACRTPCTNNDTVTAVAQVPAVSRAQAERQQASVGAARGDGPLTETLLLLYAPVFALRGRASSLSPTPPLACSLEQPGQTVTALRLLATVVGAGQQMIAEPTCRPLFDTHTYPPPVQNMSFYYSLVVYLQSSVVQLSLMCDDRCGFCLYSSNISTGPAGANGLLLCSVAQNSVSFQLGLSWPSGVETSCQLPITSPTTDTATLQLASATATLSLPPLLYSENLTGTAAHWLIEYPSNSSSSNCLPLTLPDTEPPGTWLWSIFSVGDTTGSVCRECARSSPRWMCTLLPSATPTPLNSSRLELPCTSKRMDSQAQCYHVQAFCVNNTSCGDDSCFISHNDLCESTCSLAHSSTRYNSVGIKLAGTTLGAVMLSTTQLMNPRCSIQSIPPMPRSTHDSSIQMYQLVAIAVGGLLLCVGFGCCCCRPGRKLRCASFTAVCLSLPELLRLLLPYGYRTLLVAKVPELHPALGWGAGVTVLSGVVGLAFSQLFWLQVFDAFVSEAIWSEIGIDPRYLDARVEHQHFSQWAATASFVGFIVGCCTIVVGVVGCWRTIRCRYAWQQLQRWSLSISLLVTVAALIVPGFFIIFSEGVDLHGVDGRELFTNARFSAFVEGLLKQSYTGLVVAYLSNLFLFAFAAALPGVLLASCTVMVLLRHHWFEWKLSPIHFASLQAKVQFASLLALICTPLLVLLPVVIVYQAIDTSTLWFVCWALLWLLTLLLHLWLNSKSWTTSMATREASQWTSWLMLLVVTPGGLCVLYWKLVELEAIHLHISATTLTLLTLQSLSLWYAVTLAFLLIDLGRVTLNDGAQQSIAVMVPTADRLKLVINQIRPPTPTRDPAVDVDDPLHPRLPVAVRTPVTAVLSSCRRYGELCRGWLMEETEQRNFPLYGRRVSPRRLCLVIGLVSQVYLTYHYFLDCLQDARQAIQSMLDSADLQVTWPSDDAGGSLFDESLLLYQRFRWYSFAALFAACVLIALSLLVDSVYRPATSYREIQHNEYSPNAGLRWSRYFSILSMPCFFAGIFATAVPNYVASTPLSDMCPACAPEFDGFVQRLGGTFLGASSAMFLAAKIFVTLLAVCPALIRVVKSLLINCIQNRTTLRQSASSWRHYPRTLRKLVAFLVLGWVFLVEDADVRRAINSTLSRHEVTVKGWLGVPPDEAHVEGAYSLMDEGSSTAAVPLEVRPQQIEQKEEMEEKKECRDGEAVDGEKVSPLPVKSVVECRLDPAPDRSPDHCNLLIGVWEVSLFISFLLTCLPALMFYQFYGDHVLVALFALFWFAPLVLCWLFLSNLRRRVEGDADTDHIVMFYVVYLVMYLGLLAGIVGYVAAAHPGLWTLLWEQIGTVEFVVEVACEICLSTVILSDLLELHVNSNKEYVQLVPAADLPSSVTLLHPGQ